MFLSNVSLLWRQIHCYLFFEIVFQVLACAHKHFESCYVQSIHLIDKRFFVIRSEHKSCLMFNTRTFSKTHTRKFIWFLFFSFWLISCSISVCRLSIDIEMLWKVLQKGMKFIKKGTDRSDQHHVSHLRTVAFTFHVNWKTKTRRTNLIKMFRRNTNQLQFNFQPLVCQHFLIQKYTKRAQLTNEKKAAANVWMRRSGMRINPWCLKMPFIFIRRRHLVHEKLSTSFTNQIVGRNQGITWFCYFYSLKRKCIFFSLLGFVPVK